MQLGTFNTASHFANYFKIGAPISMDAGDKYGALGAQLLGGWQLWQVFFFHVH